MSRKPIVFCDFDGTFMEKDIGHRLFTHFSNKGNHELVARWKKGEIGARECLVGEAALFDAPLEEVHTFLNQFELRPGAREFYRACVGAGYPFYIVSDGTDLYIDFLLKKHGLEEIEYFSNHAEIREGRFILTFPYDNDGCVRCGTCKGARMTEIVGNPRQFSPVIFIGDGLSDICALPHADIIFARGDLAEYCRVNNFAACEYTDFFDILKQLKKFDIVL